MTVTGITTKTGTTTGAMDTITDLFA
jgi:hypothetical protein